MTIHTHDQETIRRYLLGQLNDAEEATTEQRLLSEDDLFEEFEITKDELVEEFLSKQLTGKEREWFERNFLASPEGMRKQAFARTFDRYVSAHRLRLPKKNIWVDRFRLGNLSLLRAAVVVGVVAIVIGVAWFSYQPYPQTFASVTLTISSSTRSAGTESRRVKLKEDALRVTLLLPAPAAADARYRVELDNENGETRTSEVPGQSTHSITVDFPAAQLPPGSYVIRLSTIGTNGNVQRIPGSYYFTVE